MARGGGGDKGGVGVGVGVGGGDGDHHYHAKNLTTRVVVGCFYGDGAPWGKFMAMVVVHGGEKGCLDHRILRSSPFLHPLQSDLDVVKYLSMVEYEKRKAKLMVESDTGKAKLMVSDDMTAFIDDKGKVKVDDLQNRVERLEGDLARAKQAKHDKGKAKQVEHDKGKAKQAEHDLDDVDLVDALDLENRVKKLEEDFSRLFICLCLFICHL
ncbi:hypothetical protein Tco_0889351 [Tanacetum coccineum]